MSAEFQPIIHLSENKIFRYEALARFYNEEGLQLSTLETIKIIEECGLIHEVTDFIFDYICSLLKNKNSMTFSFNLSPMLLRDAGYIQKLQQQCARHNIPTSSIDIEISERVTRQQLIEGLPVLHAARSCGFTLSLDDFGAGNLQADSLGIFNFDTIKIDRSIITDIGTDAGKLLRLQTIITRLIPPGVKIICEGVEKKADLNQLKKYNQIAIQGYIFYRPLTINQLKLLEDF